jgi:hypothetical protein
MRVLLNKRQPCVTLLKIDTAVPDKQYWSQQERGLERVSTKTRHSCDPRLQTRVCREYCKSLNMLKPAVPEHIRLLTITCTNNITDKTPHVRQTDLQVCTWH